ncbi:MAG: TonB-dependent receptor plug domain-containing protein [Alistipes sp.]
MEHSPNERNKIYLSYVRDEYFRDLDSLSGVTVPKQRHTYNVPRLLWTLDAGSANRLTTGLEWVNEQLRFDMNPSGYDDRKSMNTGSLYVQDEILSGRPLSFVVGVRGDYNNHFGWSVTPKLSAKYAYRDFSLRANYASGYRTPSLKEMYMDFTVPIPGQTSVIRGNDRLRSESNHYVSLTAEYNRSGLNLSATVYNSYFRNKIDVRGHMEGTTTVLQYENIRRSEFSGLELMGTLRVTTGLFVRANYNYVYQSDDAPESSTQYIFPSPHTAVFQVEYGFDVRRYRIGIDATVRYVGAKTYEDFMPIVNLDFQSMQNMKYWSGTYTARHKGYAVCNAAVNASLPEGMTLTLGVDNIFDHRPSVVNFNSDITARRNLFVRLALRVRAIDRSATSGGNGRSLPPVSHSFRSCSGCRIVWPGRIRSAVLLSDRLSRRFLSVISLRKAEQSVVLPTVPARRRRYAPGRNAICRNPTILPRNVRRRSDYASLLAAGRV